MSALGLAIMIVAGAVTLDVVLENTNNTDASVVSQTVSNVDLGGFFTAGVLVGIGFMLGLMLLLAGLRRANRKRLERKELERSFAGTATHAESLQEERDRLAAELEEERRARHHAEEAVPAASGAAPATTSGRTMGEPTMAEPAMAGHDDHAMREHRTHEMAGTEQRPLAANDAPVYPSEPATGPISPATGPATGPAAGTATHQETRERTKPSLKQRLLGS